MATIMENGKRVTKKEMYERILTHTNDDLEKQFIEGEIALLEKKNSAEKKPTKTQVENAGIKGAILDYMVEGTRYTVTEIIKGCGECKDLSNQRVSAILRQMYNDGAINRVEDKRKTYFEIVVED
jgi:hypothetical protein